MVRTVVEIEMKIRTFALYTLGIGNRTKSSVNTSGIICLVVFYIDHRVIVYRQFGSLFDRFGTTHGYQRYRNTARMRQIQRRMPRPIRSEVTWQHIELFQSMWILYTLIVWVGRYPEKKVRISRTKLEQRFSSGRYLH